MSTILIASKVESSKGDRPRKYEQTHKLLCQRQALQKLFLLFIDLNEYILQTKS